MDLHEPTLIYAFIGGYLGMIGVIYLFFLIVGWKLFTKTGNPGWAVLIPFYNLYLYTQIVKRPGWWMFLYFSTLLSVFGMLLVLVISIMDNLRLAKAFGKSTGFGVGLILLSFIFLPILAFGSADYDAERLNDGGGSPQPA